MNDAVRESPTAAFELSYRYEGGCLDTRVTGGIDTLDAMVDMFMGIAAELRRQQPAALLVLDETTSMVPSAEQFVELARRMEGGGFDGVRTAYVDVRGNALARIEVGEIIAREHGYTLRVFDNEKLARIWLRYGQD